MSEVVATAQQGLAGKYPPYPEYKDSGVVWLGDVPEHWVLSRVKDVAVVFGGYPFDSQRFSPDVGVPLIRIRDINTELTAVYFDGDVPQEAIVENNDVLIGMDGEFNVARWKGGKAALNQRVACVRTDSDELTTLLFYTLPFSLKVVNDLTYYTTVKHLSLEDIKKTIFALPQGEELSNIVAFLDYETARIDRLIAQQQWLIELLKEKRQAVISHAVTKGLNPNAPMKDSGVEWLGQVPEHWVVTNLKYVFDSLDYRRIPLSAEQRGERQGDYPYYGASGVIDGVDDYLFDEECVLVGEDGANLIMRSTPLAFVVSGKYWVNNHAHILRMHDGLNRYWAAVINNVDIKPIVSGSAQPKLTAEALGNIKVAFPQDTTEREELLIHINAETPKFDELIGHANQQVILLKERRSALISAAVTGKIDLRGWTPPAEEVAA